MTAGPLAVLRTRARRLLWLLVAVAGVSAVASAAEFRQRIPIRTPDPALRLPEGARPVAAFVPVERAEVERGLRQLFAAYGSDPGGLEAMLAESFADRDRLIDTMVERLPRDARMNVLGIESVQTLNQVEMADPVSGAPVRVSTVSAVVRSQLEFNDPTRGFQRLEGRVEYLLEVRQGGAAR